MTPASRVPSGLRFLENLAYLVPGYQGYKQRILRREEDSRLRARVYRQLDRLVRTLEGLGPQWETAGQSAAHPDPEQLRHRLARLADEVRFSPGDLWAFFEAERVLESSLERLLEADLLIFADLDEAHAHAEQARRGALGPRARRALLAELAASIQQLEEHWIMRERVLAGG